MKIDIIKDLVCIKEEIGKSPVKIAYQESNLHTMLKHLEEKIDTITKTPIDSTDSKPKEIEESPVKAKKKAEIIRLLKEKKSTAGDIAILLHLSRTRCSEYLKELEREGVTKSNLRDKKMFYELITRI